ncbi:hypothetical protein SSCG_01781 [Streptomyces clavuligerus]|nr:hypothetical protein SSCG_01781 [Streptomyces clavuligerus]
MGGGPSPRSSSPPPASTWKPRQKTRRAAYLDPTIAAAVERQTKAMRALSRRAFPEPDAVADEEPAPIDQARVQRRRQAAATEAAALRRARAEGAGLVVRETVPRSLVRTA